MQENLFHSPISAAKQIESKILILYLIEKMDIPLTEAQITQFTQTQPTMGVNFYDVGVFLSDMVTAGYLEKSGGGNSARYSVTDEGVETVDVFLANIPEFLKTAVIRHVNENGKTVRQELEVVANPFYNSAVNEYTVKCGAYEDDIMLIELNLSVVSKEQALQICDNWRSNINSIYGKIIGLLLRDEM